MLKVRLGGAGVKLAAIIEQECASGYMRLRIATSWPSLREEIAIRRERGEGILELRGVSSTNRNAER